MVEQAADPLDAAAAEPAEKSLGAMMNDGHAPGRVVVVTDSTANIPPELRRRHAIRVVPITLQLDGAVLLDEIDIAAQDFYRWFKAHPTAPITTASPSPGEFLRTYQSVPAGVEGIVSIHLAAGFSGTHASALEAAALWAEIDPAGAKQVVVLDSRSVSMGCGFCVLAAARAAEEGCGLAQVVETAEAVAARVSMYATLGTLRHVIRSGRVPGLAKYAVSRLPVYLVLRVGEGKVGLARIERTRARAIRRLVELTLSGAAGRPLRLAVLHADAADEAAALAEVLRQACECLELLVTEFTAVMGAHTGPGLVGVVFYPEVSA